MLVRTALALASLGCGAPALAQQNIVYHDDNMASVGAPNAAPLGVIGVRTQQRIPGAVIGGPALIQDLFVAAYPYNYRLYNVSEVVYSDLEIRMGANSSGTLTTNWASNLPNPTVVYRGPLRVKFTLNQWSPLGLPNAYAWVPSSSADDLIIDIILWTASNTGSVPPNSVGHFMYARSSGFIQRVGMNGWTVTQPANAQWGDGHGIKYGLLLGNGNFVAHGNECLGGNGQSPTIGTQPGIWPTIGGQLSVTLASGPASSVALLYIGASDRVWQGIPLPFDLGSLGAANCKIWHDLEVLLGSSSINAQGITSLVFPIPSQANLLAQRFYVSWLALDPLANALQATTSGYATVIVGN